MEIWVRKRTDVPIDYLEPQGRRVGRCGLTNELDGASRIVRCRKDEGADRCHGYMLYRMADELRQVIVGGKITRSVGDVSVERGVESDMAGDIDAASHSRAVVSVIDIAFEEPLSDSFIQEPGEHVEEKIKNLIAGGGVFEIEEVYAADASEHVVQEKIFFVGSRETRANGKPGGVAPYESHHAVGDKVSVAVGDRADEFPAKIRVVGIQRIGKYEEIRKSVGRQICQVYIGNRFQIFKLAVGNLFFLVIGCVHDDSVSLYALWRASSFASIPEEPRRYSYSSPFRWLSQSMSKSLYKAYLRK